MRRPASIPTALAALGYAIAFAQRPGTLVADTKVNLYVAPGRFLHAVLSVWSPTSDLGHVWGGQYNGYLVPMAPWFALGHAMGLPGWVVHRLWLGTLLAVAAVGAVRLVDALVTPRRGIAHVAAGALFVVNPYVAVYVNRTSIALLAYAALPWLLLCVHEGLRDPRGWRWPAAGAVALALSGGGVNAATIGWVLVGPLALLVYELVWGGLAVRATLWPWAWRTALLAGLTSAWWVVPLAVQTAHGLDFLPFTEQPGTIWQTSSLPEVLRLMGFWTSYIGLGFGGMLRPFAGQGVLLFALPVVLAGLLVPALALTSLGWTRRARYAPFLGVLVLGGLLIMSAGFPEGTPLRHGLTFVYNRVSAVRFLRTSYKAGPLPALGLAVLGGMGLAAAVGRIRAVCWRAVALAGAAALAAVAAWPLVTGRALERQLAFHVPPAYRQAARDLGRTPPARSRAWVEPGQLFAAQTWGETIDDVLPALTDRPVTTRYIVPFADLRSTELQWETDALLAQQRLVPGQLAPLLRLQGVGDLVTVADRDRTRGSGLPTGELLAALRGQGLGGGRAYGADVPVAAAAGHVENAGRAPRVQVRPLPGRTLQVLPRAPLTVTDGGAAALLGLAAFGALDPGRAHADAPDLTRAQLAQTAASGGTFVFSDGNRRQAYVASRQVGDRGPVLRADQQLSQDGTMLDPFPAAGTGGQTVDVLRGIRAVDAPSSPQITQFPEHRPFAALDGDVRTSWLADRSLPEGRHHLDVAFLGRRDVASVRLMPEDDARGIVRAVRIGGRRFAVHRGWNTLPVGLHHVAGLSVAIDGVTHPKRANGGSGGIRELQIPGVHAEEALRTPVELAGALRGVDLRRAGVDVELERFTAADPTRRSRYAGAAQATLERDARDPEPQLRRVVTLPAAREMTVAAWAHVDPHTPDSSLDRWAGVRGALVATSSSRFDDRSADRASGAFDGGRRAWIGQWIAGRPAWLAWRTRRPVTLRALTLSPPGVEVRHPTRVRLTVDGRAGPVLPVGPGGRVVLPRPERGRAVRLDVVAARFDAGTPALIRQRRAVGVGEVRAPGLPRLRVPARGTVTLPCGSARVAVGGSFPSSPSSAGAVPLAGRTTVAALDAGAPLRLRGCAGPVALHAGPNGVQTLPSALLVDRLRLDSPAPGARDTIAPAGRVVADGHLDGSGLSHAAIAVARPAWLVFGQSFDRGWRATCDGRDLGAPTPLQGYADGWRVSAPGCRRLSVAYAPQHAVDVALIVSALAAPVVLALLLWPRKRRRRPAAPPEPVTSSAAPVPRRPREAAGLAALIAVVAGFLLAIRVGVVLAPAAFLVLWRGVPSRWLTAGAGVALVGVVPLLYLTNGPRDAGGYDPGYATQHIAAHWVTVAGLLALAFVLGRELAGASRRQ